MRVFNLCPHHVSIHSNAASPQNYPAAGLLRLTYECGPPLMLGKVPARPTKVKDFHIDLHRSDAIQRGDVLIVSNMVGAHEATCSELAKHYGVYVTGPGPAVYKRGRPVGCRGLRLWATPPSTHNGKG